MNTTTITPFSMKGDEKNYDTRNKLFVQPKTSTPSANNKITYRPSHIPNNYSPTINLPKARPTQYNGPITSNTPNRNYNGQSIQQTHFTTQPIGGSSRMYSNGGTSNSGSNRSTLPSRGTSVNSSISERSGQTFGKYKLIKEIGKGNFAKVKLAQHLITGKEVAVKIIDKTKLNSSALQKLTREVKVMKELNHPNIVKLYEVIQTERSLYLVMEYAPNGEVFEYLVKNGRMKEKDARAKFRQIVSAVQYCHQKGVVHRDLKAENLLLDKDLNIKIADFGFSNHFSRQSKLNTFCGSPPYAAPELFQGRRYEGPEVDVWSLGVILYTLISGSLPFDGGTLRELRERVLRGKYRIPFYMSSDCESLLRKMLVLNPQKRLPLTEIMKDPWINIGYEDSMLKPYLEPEIDFSDPSKIDVLLNMGFSRQQVTESLQQKRYDSITAIYLLWDQTMPKPPIQKSNSSSSIMSSYHNNRPQPTYNAPPSVSTTPAAIPEMSVLSTSQYAHSGSNHNRSQSTRFYRKPTSNTITTNIDGNPTPQHVFSNIDKHSSNYPNTAATTISPLAFDYTPTKNYRYKEQDQNKGRQMIRKQNVPDAYSDSTITESKVNEDEDIHVVSGEELNEESLLNLKHQETSLDAEDENEFSESEASSSNNKLLETSIDDVEITSVPFGGSSVTNKTGIKVKRNQTFNDYLSSNASPARKGLSGQENIGYNLFPNQLPDQTSVNPGLTNQLNKNALFSMGPSGYEQDASINDKTPNKLQRSQTATMRPTASAFRPILEPMDKLLEEPDDSNEMSKEPTSTFSRVTKGYQSLRLPDMVPPYQAFTGSPCYSNVPPKKDEPVPTTSPGTREQSPFSRNTPERATIQHVPHNKRERLQLEKAVLSGIGGPSGPSNLPTAIGGSISHPQPPRREKGPGQNKESSEECLTEQASGKSKKKISGVNSFFKTLTTKISKKKLSNASPVINRSPSQHDSSSAGQNYSKANPNQTRFDNKEKWSNFPVDPSSSPSPFFNDRTGRHGHTNKAAHYDMENLITSSCATSLTSSGSSLAAHGNKSQKPRNLRFSFRTEATSKKNPEELISEIKRVLIAFHIDYEQKSPFILFCIHGESSDEAIIQWEIEVVRLSSKSVNGIRFKRTLGPQIKFKEISKRITERLQL